MTYNNERRHDTLDALNCAVLTQLGYPEITTQSDLDGEDGEEARDTLRDIRDHGIDGGFHGFIYYTDTVAFYEDNKTEILALVRNMAQEFGQTEVEFLSGFRCLDQETVSAALLGDDEHARDAVHNALAWFAAEEVARELAD